MEFQQPGAYRNFREQGSTSSIRNRLSAFFGEIAACSFHSVNVNFKLKLKRSCRKGQTVISPKGHLGYSEKKGRGLDKWRSHPPKPDGGYIDTSERRKRENFEGGLGFFLMD